MKISLGSWAFSFGPYASAPAPWDQTVRHAAETGYDGVEISGFPPHVTLEDYSTPESWRAVRRLLEDLNLGVSGYSADFTAVNPTAASNRRRYLDLFERNVELCAGIGSPVIRVDSGAAPGSLTETEYAEAFDRLADLWHEAAERAEPAGVKVVWEFEPGFVFNKPSEILRLHERVGHPNFRILFDTAHAYMSSVVGARQQGKAERLKGGVLELLGMLRGRVGHVHVIDSDGTLYGDETSTHRPFGEGRIDFKTLAPALLALPGIEWWCVDHCFWAGCWDLVGASLNFIRNLIAEAVPA
jgi:sugar phosphate isomerase/epimerase